MDEAPLAPVFDPLLYEPVALVPADIAGELVPGIEANVSPPKFVRTRLRKGQQAIADAASLQFGRDGNAPDQEILDSQLKDQHAFERVTRFEQPHFGMCQDIGVVYGERQRLRAQYGAVAGIGGLLECGHGRYVADGCAAQPSACRRRGTSLACHERLRSTSCRKNPLSSGCETASP